MNDSSHPLLVLDYLPEFQCTKSQCEDTCCRNWVIRIDRDTLGLYQGVQDPELRPLLDTGIEKNIPVSAAAGNAGKFILTDEGCCPLLSSDNTCRVWTKLGQDFLSHTCRRYPRQDNMVNGCHEATMSLSCPEAARLCLLRPQGLKLLSVDEPDSRWDYLSHRCLENKISPVSQPWKVNFLQTRELAIGTLQNRALPVFDRLIMLGVFCSQLSSLIETGRYTGIPDLLSACQGQLHGPLVAELSRISPNPEIQFSVLRGLAEGHFFKGSNNKNYIECFDEFHKGLDCYSGVAPEAILKRYREAESLYYQPFMRNHEYIFENYLVNQAFKELFPFDDTGSVFDQYVVLAMSAALIKFHLIGMSAFHEKMTPELAVKLISSFCRSCESCSQFRGDMLKALEKHGVKTLPYLAAVLREETDYRQ